jgi:hypothetical protein
MGLPFTVPAPYLLPLTLGALILAIGALGFRAKRRRGFGPLAVGVLAASLVVVGMFALDLNLMTYVGIALLIAASVWNSWPARGRVRQPRVS